MSQDALSPLASDELARLRRKLRRWYSRHARDLPWRRTCDPYRVWISEIMLQQTTVAAVVPYYERFLRRFPNVRSLATASEQDVLRLWEGLGYYSRARNIHRMARRIVNSHDGEFPEDVETLVSLPGIGRYTAGAIVSFAFDRPAPIVEANTLRLYCRLMAFAGDPRSTEGQKRLWSFAEQLLPRRSPGRFNQALMELGATVCRPTEPECPRCPLKICCRAFRDGAQTQIPAPVRTVEITHVTEAAVAVRKRGAYLLRRRNESERWAGLWDFPRFEVCVGEGSSNRNGEIPTAMARRHVRETTGIEIDDAHHVTTLRHGVTRFRIELLCLRADYRSGRLTPRPALKWVRPASFESYPLSVTARKFARLLHSYRS